MEESKGNMEFCSYGLDTLHAFPKFQIILNCFICSYQAEILHTEMVMTPTEASVQNQRLPKGYAYVPVGVLPKGKVSAQEASASKDQ